MKLFHQILVLSILLFVTFTTTAWASNKSLCFVVQETQQAPLFVPQKICLESAQYGDMENKLYVTSTANENLFAKAKVTSLVRHNEDWYSLQAESIYHDVYESGCGDGELATLLIKGRVEVGTGEMPLTSISLQVRLETTNDVCHSHPQETIYNYVQE